VWAYCPEAPPRVALASLGQQELVEAVGSLPHGARLEIFQRPDHLHVSLNHKLMGPAPQDVVDHFRIMDRLLCGLDVAMRGETGPYR